MPETAEVPLTVPGGWEILADPPESTVVVARGTALPPEGFRPNLVVTAQDTGGMGFRDWQAGTDELLPRILDGYLLVDLERLEIAGRPGGRRLAHHTGPRGEALTMEQWFTLVDGVGHTLTATVETWRYDELADALAAAASTWRAGGEAHAG
ncbi:hypothetical protein LRP67_08300 [Nocardioides sp. cx-169]|uniref:hypothetical protein n=1 Tax=Nocardioides sp. cx-169 TaxID=2899080 RepID=UPI001E62D4B5|nr:hypothetical protein [Nocardioides sp. cx-169]MCD4534077.1 hypothetical protein [Nocardioides sp. cx-169]